MAIFSTLATLLPSVVKGGKSIYNLMNPPKKSDFGNQQAIDTFDRQIANMKGDITSRNIAKLQAKPAIRQAALAREEAKRDISGLDLSESAEAQAQISLAGKTGDTTAGIIENANISQSNANKEVRRRMDEANLMLANLQNQQTHQYKQARGEAINDVGNLFGAIGDISAGIVNIQEKNEIDGIISSEMGKVESGEMTQTEGIDSIIFQLLGSGGFGG